MRYQVVNLGGMLDDYLKEREDFKNRFRPTAPTYGTPPPPSGIEPAKTICNILRALKAEMAEDFPSQGAIDQYQKIFDETLAKIGDAGRRSAELFIRQFCPEAAHFYSGLLNQSRLIAAKRNPPPPPPPLPRGPDVATFDDNKWPRPPARPPVPTGSVVKCPPGQFWDGRQCRGSVSTSYGGMLPYASMTGAGIPARPIGIIEPSAQRFLRSRNR